MSGLGADLNRVHVKLNYESFTQHHGLCGTMVVHAKWSSEIQGRLPFRLQAFALNDIIAAHVKQKENSS